MRTKAMLRPPREAAAELISLNKRPAAATEGASLSDVVKSHLKNLRSQWRKRGEGFSSYWLGLEPQQQVLHRPAYPMVWGDAFLNLFIFNI